MNKVGMTPAEFQAVKCCIINASPTLREVLPGTVAVAEAWAKRAAEEVVWGQQPDNEAAAACVSRRVRGR